LTPELRERILELYRSEGTAAPRPWRELRAKISEQLWVKPQLIAEAVQGWRRTQAALTEEQKARAIEMY
jgi:hypothetical protein